VPWRRTWPIPCPSKRCSRSLPITSTWPNALRSAGREQPRNLRAGLRPHRRCDYVSSSREWVSYCLISLRRRSGPVIRQPVSTSWVSPRSDRPGRARHSVHAGESLRTTKGEHRRARGPTPEATKLMAAAMTQSVAMTCAQIATIPKNSASEASVATSSTRVRPMSQIHRVRVL
jgi:hypothetical protein